MRDLSHFMRTFDLYNIGYIARRRECINQKPAGEIQPITCFTRAPALKERPHTH